MDLKVDSFFVSRLLIGALSAHEQRLLAAQLARCDTGFRASLAEVLEPFEVFDSELTAEYSALLEQGSPCLEEERRRILDRSFSESLDLEMLAHGFTVTDALSLGVVTRQFFSWSMAELFLQRSRENDRDPNHAWADSTLALMVIDVVEMLGAVGSTQVFANVVADVRRRIREAASESADFTHL